MVLDLPVVGESVGPCDAESVTGTLACTRLRIIIGIDGEVIHGCERTIVLGIILHTHRRTELQILIKIKFRKKIGRGCECVGTVVDVGHHQTVGIAVGVVPIAVGCIVIGTAVGIVVTVDGCNGSRVEGATERVVILVAHRNAALLGINDADLFTDLKEVVDDLVFRIHAEVVAFIVGDISSANDTFLIQITA